MASVFSTLLIFSLVGRSTMMSYAGTVNQALGIQTSRIINPGGEEGPDYFQSSYGELTPENLQLLIADTYEEAMQEEAEGAVLLQNEGGALPLAENERSVTLFGHAVVQPLYKNSSAGSSGHNGPYNIDLYTALKNEGFEINDTLYKAYQKSGIVRAPGGFDPITQTMSEFSMGEVDGSFYTQQLQDSWKDSYHDLALVMLSREGGEGHEIQIEDPVEGISQLALHQEEKDLLEMIRDSGAFGKVIVLVNSGNPMELGWLEEYGVDACLWIGCPGQRGFEAVAKILTGEVNPSGHLVDTYAYSSVSAPAVVNGSFNNQTWGNLEEVLSAIDLPEGDISYSTTQAEGIYVGYKYYETRYEDTVLDQGGSSDPVGSIDGEKWEYHKEVQFPFGYGLSYTDFEQTLDSVSIDGDEIKAVVTVTNVGQVPGRDVVQLYAQTPYGAYEKENLVEKSAIQLLNFGKTQVLQPGESETLTLIGDKYLLASYDYLFQKGYILSEGDYYVAIGENAHDALNNVLCAKKASGMTGLNGEPVEGDEARTYHWTEEFDNERYAVSRYTEAVVTNQFDDANPNNWEEGTVTYLSRQDWAGTYPAEPTVLTLSPELIRVLAGSLYEKAADGRSVSDFVQGENQGMPLAALIGLPYDDPKWETYLNQFTIEELCVILADNFGTAEITSVGKPAVRAGDGPDGVGGTYDSARYKDDRNDTSFPTEIVLASSFNPERLTRRAELMAEECMYLGMAEDWMPGGNLHRTPFGGRNFEYYSEDANMNYLCEIPEVLAMEAKGVHAGSKHLTGNDQENNREGIAVLFNEQAFREGALRGFEGSLAVAGARAVMHGYNRIGLTWCSESTALCDNVAEKEWGFTGQQESDAVIGLAPSSYKYAWSTAVKAGTDNFCLDFSGGSSRAMAEIIRSNDDGELLSALRKSNHDYLYTVANSNIMNGYSTDSVIESVTPWWQGLTLGLIIAFAVLDLLCIMMIIRQMTKKVSEGVSGTLSDN